MSSTSDTRILSLKCVICAGVPSDKIVKDDNYLKMMSLYWQGIGVDVKPKENNNFDLCISCFEGLIQFYETNDICIFFEHSLAEARNHVLRKTLKGILKRQEESEPLTELQSSIQKKWGTKLEPEDANDTLKGYNLKTYIETEEVQLVQDGANLSSTSASTISTRKKASSDDGSQKSKASEKTAEKASKSTTKKAKVPRRGRARRARSVWSSTSESTTDELSSSGSEDSDFVP